jgi:multidrug efflux pump subunit AcrB
VSDYAVPLAFLPKDNKNTFLITIHRPDASPLETTAQVVKVIEKELVKNNFILNYESYIGTPSVIDFNGQLRGSGDNRGEQFAEIRVNLIDKSQRKKTSIQIVQDLRQQLRQQEPSIFSLYPETVIQLLEDPPGPPVRATVLAEIYGLDNKQLYELAKKVEQEYKKTWDMAEVWTSNLTTIPEYRLQIIQEQAALSDVSVHQVSQALEGFIRGKTLSYLHNKESRSGIPIRLIVPREQRITPDMLATAFVKNNKGKAIPLSRLITIIEGEQAHPILHQDMERVVYVGGELNHSAPVYAVLALEKTLDGMAISNKEQNDKTLTTTNLGFVPVKPYTVDGYKLHWAGELRLTLDAFRDMGIALGLSLLVIYLLLVGYYQSFTIPLLVMISVPLAMIGVFPAHWLLDITFSAASMVGVIALAGIVVRNSLLIVDFIRELRAQGIPLEQAAQEAGALRLRPILLTTLAIVLGTAIMVSDPVFGGLAISLIAGSISSAVFTVFVVPLLYQLLETE